MGATGRTGPGDAPFVIGCLFLFMMFQAGGLQVIGWLTGSEIYPLRVRAAGTSAQAATVWGANLLLTGTALALIHYLGAGGAIHARAFRGGAGPLRAQSRTAAGWQGARSGTPPTKGRVRSHMPLSRHPVQAPGRRPGVPR